MPRITYHDRFAALLAKDYMSDRDRTFTESLYSSYKRKKALTAGRRRCFLQMEERYATRPEPMEGADELDVILERIQVTDGSAWDRDFTRSVQQQLRRGRRLSERQTQILTDIKSKYTDECMAARDQWIATWDESKTETYKIAMEYYGHSGYYGKLVSAWKADPTLVPSMDNYKRVTDNKFIRKVLAGWHAEPKFSVGSMVSMGACATRASRLASLTGLAVVVATNAAIPTRAAKGCKVYKVLPVGAAKTILCDERELKAHRTPKKKKTKK